MLFSFFRTKSKGPAYISNTVSSGRKHFRRLNEADQARSKFEPLVPFTPSAKKVRIPDDFKTHNGKDPVGLWQYEFLRRQGLEPRHHMLDIGCGDLREGVPLIRFLEAHRYVGVDQTRIAIIQGSLSLTQEDWHKKPVFFVGGDFGFEAIERKFDYLWAHSVWTHVDLSLVGKCMASAYEVMAPGGIFMASYFAADGDDPWRAEIPYRERKKKKGLEAKSTYSYRNPYHHRTALLEKIALDIGFKRAEKIEEMSPKKQAIFKMVK